MANLDINAAIPRTSTQELTKKVVGNRGGGQVNEDLVRRAAVEKAARIAAVQGTVDVAQRRESAAAPGVALGRKSPMADQEVQERSQLAKELLPTFSENPVGFLGNVLSATAAGWLGQPSPITEKFKLINQAERQQAGLELQREGLKLRQVSTGFNILNEAAEMLETLPPEERGAFIQGIEQQASDIGFPIGDHLRDLDDQQTEEYKRNLEWLKDNPDALLFLGLGGPEEIESLIATPGAASAAIEAVREAKVRIGTAVAKERELRPERVQTAQEKSNIIMTRQMALEAQRSANRLKIKRTPGAARPGKPAAPKEKKKTNVNVDISPETQILLDSFGE